VVATLVVLAALLPLATVVSNQARSRALSSAETDAQSVAAALAVGASIEPEAGVTVELAEAVIEAFQNRPGLSIIFPDGTARGGPFKESANIDRAREGSALTATTPDGAEVLVPVLGADAPTLGAAVVVRAFVPSARLREGVVGVWVLLALVGIALVAIAGVASDRLGRRLVRPVADLSNAARAFAEGDLETRVVPSGPEELAEVGDAFNFLASRLETLLREEREEVADLSHRLRTPLTALRLQAETLSDPDESAALLADIGDMEQAVDRMIQDARRPAADSELEPPVADLGEIVRHRADFWRILADEQQRPAEVATRGGRLPVPLAPEELGAVIDTLLENVFSHTDPGTAYRIGSRPGLDHTAVLTIEDGGPGFDEDSLVERGRSGGGSTGLGLDIVRKAAEKTGGMMSVSNNSQGGGRIEVVFGTTER
jgi:signal transduction histidine kinase